MKKITTNMIAGCAVLTALEIILQIIGNYVAIGPVNINLSLLPICIGAIIYGPLAGLFLGAVNGCMVLASPSTIAVFMPITVIGTVLTCLLKGMLSGLIAGLLFLPFRNKNKTIGSVISSLSVPLINTGLFVGFSLIFFQPFLEKGAEGFPNKYAFLFLGVIGWNFIFEFLVAAILTPVIIKIVNIVVKNTGDGI